MVIIKEECSDLKVEDDTVVKGISLRILSLNPKDEKRRFTLLCDNVIILTIQSGTVLLSFTKSTVSLLHQFSQKLPICSLRKGDCIYLPSQYQHHPDGGH